MMMMMMMMMMNMTMIVPEVDVYHVIQTSKHGLLNPIAGKEKHDVPTFPDACDDSDDLLGALPCVE